MVVSVKDVVPAARADLRPIAIGVEEAAAVSQEIVNVFGDQCAALLVRLAGIRSREAGWRCRGRELSAHRVISGV
jgi:hypothetical protein